MPYVQRPKLILVDEAMVGGASFDATFAVPPGEAAAAVRAFFDNGGGPAYVSRSSAVAAEEPGAGTAAPAPDAVEPFA